jgi:hypothetical protein
VFSSRIGSKTAHKSSSQTWTVAETKALVRGIDHLRSTHQASKPVSRATPGWRVRFPSASATALAACGGVLATGGRLRPTLPRLRPKAFLPAADAGLERTVFNPGRARVETRNENLDLALLALRSHGDGLRGRCSAGWCVCPRDLERRFLPRPFRDHGHRALVGHLVPGVLALGA